MSKLCIFLLTCLLLAACTTVPITPIPVESSPVAVTEEGSITVAFLLAESPTDQGWNAAHYRGIEALQSLGEVVEENNLSFTVDLTDGGLLNVVVIEDIGYSDADIERVMRSVLNQQQPDILFATWWDSKDAVVRLAPEYPVVYFEHSSGYPVIASGENVSTYFIRQEYGDYVAGYVTGRLGYTNTGLVGTFSIPEPVRGINGYALGLQEGLRAAGLDPSEGTVRVVWINSWLDPVQEREAALALTDSNIQVVRQMADTPHSSQAACSVEGMVAVGYGTDVSPYADCALLSNEWNWGAYYIERVQQVMAGTWSPQDWWEGFNEGAIGLVGWNETLVPAAIQEEALALVDTFLDGFDPFCGPISGYGRDPADANATVEITVPEGQCLSDMDLLTMQWFVSSVEGELPLAPTNGYELELRSE